MSSSPLFIGIDVGTGSARAGVFDVRGHLLGSANHPIRMWRPRPDFVEQSSEDIWGACSKAVRAAMKKAGVNPDRVAGLGFDATCSLVLLDESDHPVSASPSGEDCHNVIVWMDHRAIAEAEEINATKHPALRYVGGVISPEMQTPKLLWLKRHLPKSWKRTARFFDLPDFLTYRATGDDTRSLCSTVCKWTYLGHRGPDGAGWEKSFFQKVGLDDLSVEGFARIGRRVRPMGEPLGRGLTAKAAKDFGLREGTPVGVSIIDAHAGGLGMLGASINESKVSTQTLETRLALIGGTSSCHMAVSAKPRFIRGIWGPYFSAMIPDLWLNEGGQSATGALIDHIIHSHPAASTFSQEAKKAGKTVYEMLNNHLDGMAREERVAHAAALTYDLHILPDFHGNRSPLADPTLRGVVSGLPLSSTKDDLARQYLAAIQSVAYGTRHILEEMNRKGCHIDTLFICGGGTKNPVFLREHADITGCHLVLPREPEAVLLGSALLGAVASGRHQTVFDAMAAMNCAGKIYNPAPGKVKTFHEQKYRVFRRLHRDFAAWRRIMNSPVS